MSGYSKYTISQKVQACEDYLAGIRTAKQISSDLGIPPKNHTNIHEWVSKYRLWGEEAFITLSGNKAYTADFKMQMVEKYISGSESVREIVAKYNIGSDVFPETEIQHCIIHQIRNTTKFVSYKDLKALMADLKRVYTASTEEIARLELEAFAEKWDSKYPNISKSWNENRATLSTYFKYTEEVRKIIYTTNTVEGFNRQLRKVTKNKSVFPTDDSLLKMLFLAAMDITRKWTGHRQDWGKTRAQLMIYFEDGLKAMQYC